MGSGAPRNATPEEANEEHPGDGARDEGDQEDGLVRGAAKEEELELLSQALQGGVGLARASPVLMDYARLAGSASRATGRQMQ